MAFNKKPCCAGCARKPSQARISGNPVAKLFQMGGEVMFADGGEARTDIGAAGPEYTSIYPGSEYPDIGPFSHLSGALLRPFLRREVLSPEETRSLGDETIRINPETGMPETLSMVETIPGEYGPIELTDWPSTTDLLASGVGRFMQARDFLSRPENREQLADMAKKLPEEAIQATQDYIAEQVDMANRGLTEAYDPESGDMAAFTVPLLAAEIMTGSLARPAVQLADNEMLTGMAVRPKKAVVRPASTHQGFNEDPTVRRIEMEENEAQNLQEYEELLGTRLSEQGFDPAIVEEVVRKADKYFMNELGTADDPLRQAMLGGILAPEFFESPHITSGRWDKDRKYLTGGLEDREGFERRYDSSSGVKRTLVDPRSEKEKVYGGELLDFTPALVSEATQMLSEGVPRNLISGRHSGFVGLSDDTVQDIAEEYGVSAERIRQIEETRLPPLSLDVDTVYPHRPRIDRFMPGYLARAYEQGEMVYDIDPSDWDRGLHFLSPERLAEQLTAFTADEIRGRSFPDLVVEAQTRFLPPAVEQRKLARQINRDSSSIGAEERNARVPTKFKTEVGVTSVYPMDDRTWYSLDTDGAVELEGALMNHSVGGYSSQIPTDFAYSDWKKQNFADNRTLVFSLRDKDGRSRVTTDLHFSSFEHPDHPGYMGEARPQVLSAYGYNNANVPSEHLEELFSLWKYFRVRPQSALPEGVAGGQGAQYMTYLQTGEVFGVQDALDFVDGQLPVNYNPDPGEMELAEGGIVSLVNGCGFNQRRGNN